MNTITSVLSSRTVWFAIALAAASVMQGFVFLLPITPLHQMYAGIAIAVGIVVFRAITTQPLVPAA